MNLRVIFRPLCWTVGHLWEQVSTWDRNVNIYGLAYVCDRCGLRSAEMPEGW